MEKEYAQALFDLSQKPEASADDLVKKLVAHLKESGREKLLPRIARELNRLDARTQSFGEQLEVASPHEKESAQSEAQAFGITAEAEVNDTLISGWRARSGSRVIDRSGKRALLDLYQAIANA
jgi:F0F1-type ATP synthase delta subunit